MGMSVSDATLNGLVEGAPCTLKVKDDEVALIPATVPLSIDTPEERVDADVHRERNPLVPPERDPEIPRDDVATHRVVVPVVWSTMPRVPVELDASNTGPRSDR